MSFIVINIVNMEVISNFESVHLFLEQLFWLYSQNVGIAHAGWTCHRHLVGRSVKCCSPLDTIFLIFSYASMLFMMLLVLHLWRDRVIFKWRNGSDIMPFILGFSWFSMILIHSQHIGTGGELPLMVLWTSRLHVHILICRDRRWPCDIAAQ